jgi:endonuclease III
MYCLWSQVNEVTPELFTVAPDAAAMAAQDIPVVQKIIQPIGLAPTKAKNLVNMAKVRHWGQVTWHSVMPTAVELSSVGYSGQCSPDTIRAPAAAPLS